jgi:hypothetical protein
MCWNIIVVDIIFDYDAETLEGESLLVDQNVSTTPPPIIACPQISPSKSSSTELIDSNSVNATCPNCSHNFAIPVNCNNGNVHY